MKKITLFICLALIGLLVVSSTGTPLQAAIPAEERAALVAFYIATNGDNWYNNTRWKGVNPEADGFSESGSEDNWYGIIVSDDHVTEIRLSYNGLNGSIPPELGNLNKLKYLVLDSNQLSGSIPPELGNLNNLEYLILYYNKLSGSIPKELENLINLVELDLDGNQLSGSIPRELGNLSNLESLWLCSNRLSGNIPPELGNLNNLEYLRLYCNQLSGSIPPELGSLSNLEGLYLGNNQLSGNIPEELGNLSNLGILYLNDNRLWGIIPISLMNLTNLVWINIEGNCLYTNDPDLKAWLDNFDNEWEKYQCEGEEDPPIGAFETPIDGSAVCSSIAVTGWALDDFGIENVKIYRQQGSDLVYIGDAVFVEGARPDIAAAYPDYPDNTRAGWGYMLLTNFLPNCGNGTFVLHAIARDYAGKTTTLGTKTISCDNADACKPFGAIDTPMPGGDASGSSFKNQGWVLTPMPNKIPEDGSTIGVYVDGVKLGHTVYNIYRADIASLFPGYANSSGSLAYYNLDTTAYADGMHQIFWIATDNAGNADGIGSRFFSIQNANGTRGKAESVDLPGIGTAPDLSYIPSDYSMPVLVKKGFDPDDEPMAVSPGVNGTNRIVIKELERIEVYLTLPDQPSTGHSYSGFMMMDSRLTGLPIGSTLDEGKGIFYWQPGPGFLGEYHLVFVETAQDGTMLKKTLTVEIVPGQIK